jgi:hypothetical protein
MRSRRRIADKPFDPDNLPLEPIPAIVGGGLHD